ncbi:MAG: pyruvate dehydrogenase (acetyl-transferring), homodimeric type, partial [Bryobacteraceae bacterium]
GEGLQHEDGHSHLLASTVPTCVAYDPAYAYEIAVIVQNGIKRMYQDGEDVFFYLTVENENYPQPEMPAGVEEGILKGLYRVHKSTLGEPKVQLLGAGSILNEVIRAQAILESKFGIPADVYSVTSYNELRREALHTERWNRLHPAEDPKVPYLLQVLGGTEGPIVGSSDYMKVLFDQLSPWLPNRLYSLGTDGFGRSESRPKLRRFFEVDAESVVVTALFGLAKEGKYEPEKVKAAIAEFGLDPDRADPSVS